MIFFTLTPIYFATPEYDYAVSIRSAELRIPLGLEFEAFDLDHEYNQHHFGLFSFPKDEMYGCLTFVPLNDKELKMRQVVVSQKYQGKKIGALMVEKAEAWAKLNHFSKISLNARLTIEPFYKKLNYQSVGEIFTEVGIDHIKMEKYIY